MPSKSNSRGRAFEDKVLAILLALRLRLPTRVRVFPQPRLKLHDGQTVIPDIELQYDLPPTTHCLLIECQSRKRSSTAIAHKIRYIKGASDRNRFMFVYHQAIPTSTRNALEKAGVVVLSLHEFSNYINTLKSTLERTEPLTASGQVLEKRRGYTTEEPSSYTVERKRSFTIEKLTSFTREKWAA